MKTRKQFGKKGWKSVSKYLPIMLVFAVAGVFFSSCDDWLDNDSEPLYWSYGVVHKSDSEVSISTDKGNKLYPNTSFKNKIKDQERYVLKYFIDECVDTKEDMEIFEISVYDYYKVLTKDIIPFAEEISDSLGLDPVKVNHAWVANDFINFYFTYWGGEPGIKHMVNLTQLPGVDDEGRIVLEFRHNANEDPYNYQYKGMVSFPVESLELPEGVDSSKIKLLIKYQNVNGEKNVELDIHFSDEPEASEIDYNALDKQMQME